MNVADAAAELQVSPRRVRALIGSGRITAHKVDGNWEIVDLGNGSRQRRPLSERSRELLAVALHERTLHGLTGHDRLRTAARIRELRAATDPAQLLIDWWGGRDPGPGKVSFGHNLAQHALAGERQYVHEALHRPRHEYLRRAEDLAEVVASERTIQNLTRRQLADAAAVPVEVLAGVERGRPLSAPGAVRRVLRVLGVEPTALPELALDSPDASHTASSAVA